MEKYVELAVIEANRPYENVEVVATEFRDLLER